MLYGKLLKSFHLVSLYNCLLNSIKLPYNVVLHKNKDIMFEVSKINAISEKSRTTLMRNPVIHDFVILVYVYLNVIKSNGVKQKGIEQLKWLFDERMLQHKEYFEKNLPEELMPALVPYFLQMHVFASANQHVSMNLFGRWRFWVSLIVDSQSF